MIIQLKKLVTSNRIVFVSIILVLACILLTFYKKDKFQNVGDPNGNDNDNENNNNDDDFSSERCGEGGVYDTMISQLDTNLKRETERLDYLNSVCDGDEEVLKNLEMAEKCNRYEKKAQERGTKEKIAKYRAKYSKYKKCDDHYKFNKEKCDEKIKNTEDTTPNSEGKTYCDVNKKDLWNLCENRTVARHIKARITDDLSYQTLEYCNSCEDDDLYKEQCEEITAKLQATTTTQPTPTSTTLPTTGYTTPTTPTTSATPTTPTTSATPTTPTQDPAAAYAEAQRQAFEEELRNKQRESQIETDNSRGNIGVTGSNITGLYGSEYAALDDIGSILENTPITKNNIEVVRDLLESMGYNNEQIDAVMKNRPGKADTSLPYTQLKPADKDGIYLSSETNKVDQTYDNLAELDSRLNYVSNLQKQDMSLGQDLSSGQYGNYGPPIIYQEDIKGVSNIFAPNIVINNPQIPIDDLYGSDHQVPFDYLYDSQMSFDDLNNTRFNW